MSADELDSVDGEHAGAGHYCPARRPLEGAGGGPSESIVGGERLQGVQATAKEEAAITQLLKERAESAPAGAGVGRASALAWAGLKLAAAVLLAAGVVVGFSDGDEFDDVGCSVAQQPSQTCHGAHSAQARERGGGKLPGSDGGSAGGSGDGGPGGRPECEVRAAMCAHRMADGQCQRSNQRCLLLTGAGEAGGKAKTLNREMVQADMWEARFVFRKAGSRWRVVFDGTLEFNLEDTLGARYLDYLLHHPNQVISAFDLEVAVRPEKAGARSRNSIQREAEAETARAYLRELTRLTAEREEASESGELAEVDRLDREIGAFEEALRSSGLTGDTGERARSNVNKALAVVRRRLARGDKAEKAFGEHVERFVSVGYQCMYAQPGGECWA